MQDMMEEFALVMTKEAVRIPPPVFIPTNLKALSTESPHPDTSQSCYQPERIATPYNNGHS